MSPRVWLCRSLVAAVPGVLALLAAGPLATACGSVTLPCTSTRPSPTRAPTTVPVTTVPVTAVPVTTVPVTTVPVTTVPVTTVPVTTVPVTAVPPTDVPTGTLLASRTARGGLCIIALCEQRYRVHVDGRWDYVDNVRRGEGRLSPEDLDALKEAVATTRIAEAAPFTGLCPTAWDGSELFYGWIDGDGRHEESTCSREIPDTDPLVEVLDRLVTDAQDAAEDTGGPPAV